MSPLALAALAAMASGVAAETCLSSSALGGLIFGCIAGTLVICLVIALVICYCVRRGAPRTDEKSAYANDACDVEDRGVDAEKKITFDKKTFVDSFKLKPRKNFGVQISLSTEKINELNGAVDVRLESRDLSGLGFLIHGNMNDGIYIKEVIPKGPADLSGNIHTGDRIRSLTINFDSIVFEDAVTLLSYASPYGVRLELERPIETPQMEMEQSDTLPRIHPLFRSNTLKNPPVSRAVDASLLTVQKHGLPPAEVVEVPEPPVASPPPSSETDESERLVASSTTFEAIPLGPPTSQSTSASSIPTEPSLHSISDRIEISELIVDKPLVVMAPVSPRLRAEPVLPSSPPPPPPPPSPPAPPPQVEPETPPSPPTAAYAISAIPVPKRESPKAKKQSSPATRPEITDAKVSRIPKRSDSQQKTPIIERKLPKLPSSALQPKQTQQESQRDVWSRLYQDKRKELRKVRDSESSLIPSPVPAASPPQEQRYGTLDREKRQRLEANQEILEKQKEELRQLGIL